ncbi:MAG TPA: SDR family NAD(P)-dependent oxidoreductase [Verrucomicrobiae bacterium]|nr:SDR family NAD(P)-dependent oxidoreductase [Verrucomicrobiae bacterium]
MKNLARYGVEAGNLNREFSRFRQVHRIERLLHTNLLGSIVFAKAVIPHMRRQGGGRILQISSEQSQMAYPGLSLQLFVPWTYLG